MVHVLYHHVSSYWSHFLDSVMFLSMHLLSFEFLRDGDVLPVEAVHNNSSGVVVSGSSGDVENSRGGVR